MSVQVIDAKPLTDRQITEPARLVVVDSRMDERDQGAVGRTHTERSVTGTAELLGRIDQSLQRHVQVQIRTYRDDGPYQLFHLVARSDKLVKAFVRFAHQRAPALTVNADLSCPWSIAQT
jgi:hypothetical protein